MKIISQCLAILLLVGTGSQELLAQELTICSMFGNPNINVVDRVNAVKSGRISAGPKIKLHSNSEGACNSDECLVTSTSPLNAGHEGVEIDRHQSWVCVAVPGKKPLDVWLGWIPEQRWQQSNSKQDLKGWTGVWQNDYAKIKIKLSEAQELSVTGHALWVGGAMRISHFGNIDLKGVPDNGVLSTSSSEPDFGCHVALRLVGSFIFAADNRKCGGMNATFDGVYRFRHGLQE